MIRNAASVLFLVVAVAMLSAFRMPVTGKPVNSTLYDVRGAFVTVGKGVSPETARDIERLLKASIQATVRTEPLPRVIASLRVDEITRKPFLFGQRYYSRFTVKVASVANGAVIAMGVYTVEAANRAVLNEKIVRAAGNALSLTSPDGLSVSLALDAALHP